MASWQAGDVEANGIRLHYTRTGGDKPPLILAHGVTDTGLCWTPIAKALEGDYDVIMVDARGHGHSDAPEQGYGIDELARDLHGVIQALSLHKPLLLGHSLGAATVLALAGTYPDVPGAILLEDPPMWWLLTDEPQPEELARHATIGERLLRLKPKSKAELIDEQHAAKPRWSAAELDPWSDAKRQVSQHVLKIFTPQSSRAVDWVNVLPRITCPALLITADPELDAAVTQAGAAALKELIPQLEIAHVPGAGHNIRREQFERFMTVVGDFLAKQIES
jgi:N-formylmaleamate deformylase